MSSDLWPKLTVFPLECTTSSYVSARLFFEVTSAVSGSLNSRIFQNDLLAEGLNYGLMQQFSIFGVHQIYLRCFLKRQVVGPTSDLSNLNFWRGGKDICILTAFSVNPKELQCLRTTGQNLSVFR